MIEKLTTISARNPEVNMPFYMGKTEVTNAHYRRFGEASGYDGTGDIDPDPFYDMNLNHWRGKSIMSQENDYPVVWVSWKNAKKPESGSQRVRAPETAP